MLGVQEVRLKLSRYPDDGENDDEDEEEDGGDEGEGADADREGGEDAAAEREDKVKKLMHYQWKIRQWQAAAKSLI